MRSELHYLDTGNAFQPRIKIINCHYHGVAKKAIYGKHLLPPSKNRRPDFLKTPIGLELDIYYPDYGFAIERRSQTASTGSTQDLNTNH
ncbi:hypothetical protein Glove_109g277 [Diversispora epigaea]|uniref:Uncharacterized protein n=1 Tax=Diversispora epigaea TaxID=1348612 RepID=A0A397J506_9GLOM|nr:hypothetical protein Glove_109g277 [Diversispora epigaea]